MGGGWVEIADRVYVRRYAFYDQNIVAVRGRDEVLLVDTRSTAAQAREVLRDLGELGSPVVGAVVNTHGHYDHAFGNHAFRPSPIWGHERCATMIRRTGEAQRERVRAELPALSAELDEVVLDPPEHTFTERASICLDDGREVRLRYLGRGHTDNDVVATVSDADVLLAGDLLENGATPYFGDGWPLDWPDTVRDLLALVGHGTVVVPGHGDHAGRAFVEAQLAAFEAVASAAARVDAGEATLDEAVALVPWPASTVREPLERALAQARGELGA